MSSNFLSRPLDWSKYDVVFACAQKNLGPAGVTVIIVRKSLLGKKRPDTPILCDWELFLNCGGFYNTPNVFGIYMCGLNLAHMKKNGLAYYDDLAKRRSSLIYDVIDNSNGFYKNEIDINCRSRMNCQFRLATKEDDDAFLKAAT